jgi:hypothetical protein
MLKRALSLLVLTIILLAGCQAPSSTPTTTLTPDTGSATLTPLEATAVPSLTPTPEAARAILVLPETADLALYTPLQAAFSELTGAAGMLADVRTNLQPADLTVGVRIVVLAEEPADLGSLLAAGAQAQWLVITHKALEGNANLTILRRRMEWEAFVAGYVTMLVTADWRAGALIPADTPIGAQFGQDFENGARYFCGQCRSALAPIVDFPVVSANLGVSSSAAEWLAAAEQLRASYLYGMYVAPQIATPDLLQPLAAYKLVLVGGRTPSDDAVRQRWAATIDADLGAALRLVWQDLVSAQPGKTVDIPPRLSDVNESWLGKGRQQRVNEVIQALLSGQIHPDTIPSE